MKEQCCPSGHRGAIGWSSTMDNEDMLTIIDFRNKKYNEDIELLQGTKDRLHKVDKMYDNIDNAIWKLMKHFDKR
jgi:hypothetical protein